MWRIFIYRRISGRNWFNHKTCKTRQNLKKEVCGDCTTVRRREAAGWRASSSFEKSFAGFDSFVQIQLNN
jgi:hypothetical protein